MEGAARLRIMAGAVEHPLTTAVVAAGADRTPTLVAVVVEVLIAEVVVEVDTPRRAAATEAIANYLLG